MTRKTVKDTEQTTVEPDEDILDFDTDFAKDGGEALGKLLRSHRFQTLVHSDKGDDSVEMLWTINQFIETTLTPEGAEKLFAKYDDVIEAFNYLSKKVSTLTASDMDD